MLLYGRTGQEHWLRLQHFRRWELQTSCTIPHPDREVLGAGRSLELLNWLLFSEPCPPDTPPEYCSPGTPQKNSNPLFWETEHKQRFVSGVRV